MRKMFLLVLITVASSYLQGQVNVIENKTTKYTSYHMENDSIYNGYIQPVNIEMPLSKIGPDGNSFDTNAIALFGDCLTDGIDLMPGRTFFKFIFDNNGNVVSCSLMSSSMVYTKPLAGKVMKRMKNELTIPIDASHIPDDLKNTRFYWGAVLPYKHYVNLTRYDSTLCINSCDVTFSNYDCAVCQFNTLNSSSEIYNQDADVIMSNIDSNPVYAFYYFLAMTGYDRYLNYDVSYDPTMEGEFDMITVQAEPFSGQATIVLGKEFNSSYYFGTLIRKMYHGIIKAEWIDSDLYNYWDDEDIPEFLLKYYTLFDEPDYPQGSVSWVKHWIQGATSIYNADIHSTMKQDCDDAYNKLLDLKASISSISDSNCY